MSPISEKFLLGRLGLGEAPGAKIDTDRPCTNCGYNLRGLTFGRNCPECGTPVRRRVESGPPHDLLGTGEPEIRQRLLLGLTLGAASLVVAVLARWGVLVAALASGDIPSIYTWGVAVNGAVWVVAVWLVTSPALDRHWPKMAPWRWIVRLTQVGWPLGLVMLAIARHGNVGQAVEQDLMKWQTIARLVAGVGLLQFIAILHVMARASELDTAPKRLYLAGWFIPLAAVILWGFPSSFPWIFLLALLILLVAWSWAMGLLALAMWEMRSVAVWSLRALHESVERDSRIAAKRAEFDRESAAHVRPVSPQRPPDVPLDP